MRSVADIPGDADDDLPEISPELVLVDPDLARRVREDAAAAAAAAAAANRDRPFRLVLGAARVEVAEPAGPATVPAPPTTQGSTDAERWGDNTDNQEQVAEPADPATVPAPPTTQGSTDAERWEDDTDNQEQVAEPADPATVPAQPGYQDVEDGEQDTDSEEHGADTHGIASGAENDEFVVPRAVALTAPSTQDRSDGVDEPTAIGEPTAPRAIVPIPAVAELSSARAPEVIPIVSEPVGEPEAEKSIVPQAIVVTPAVVAEPEPTSALAPEVIPIVSEPVGESSEAEESIVPQAIVATPPVAAKPEPTSALPAAAPPTVSEAAHEIPPGGPSVVARPVGDAPARAVMSTSRALPASVPETADVAPEPQSSATLTPAMPHPIARPGGPTRAPQALRGRRRGRGAVAFLVSVAVASVAVLGILNLTGGTSSSGADALPASGQPGQSSSGKATGTAQRDDSAKANAKARAKAQAEAAARAEAAKAAAAAKAKAAAKAQAAAKAKAARAAAAQPATKPSAAPSTNGSSRPAATPGPTAATEPRRFAWAPVEGAIAYHVELFRGADRVLAKETNEPILELGSTWRFEGRIVRLTPGTYRWYVWPVTKTGRATQAVVQAKLSIP